MTCKVMLMEAEAPGKPLAMYWVLLPCVSSHAFISHRCMPFSSFMSPVVSVFISSLFFFWRCGDICGYMLLIGFWTALCCAFMLFFSLCFSFNPTNGGRQPPSVSPFFARVFLCKKYECIFPFSALFSWSFGKGFY